MMTRKNPVIPQARIVPTGLLIGMALLLVSCSRIAPTSPGPGWRPHSLGAAGQDFGDSAVVVYLAAGSDAQEVAADHGVALLDWEDDYASFLPRIGQTQFQLQQELAGDPRVISSEFNARFDTAESRQGSWAFDDGHNTPRDFAEQPAAASMHLDMAHSVSRGRGILVAILDTGADLSHPALQGRYVGGYDYIDHDTNPTDVLTGLDTDGDGLVDEAYGHGTHVAGIVALTAPDAKLFIIRVLDSNGRGSTVDVAAGIRLAVARGARVINLSLGTVNPSSALESAVLYAEAHGVVVAAAAGNWGAESPEEYPAHYPQTLGVAAVDVLARPATFTSFGLFVKLSAPGVGIRSAYPGGRYLVWSGTSMSTPFVAGTSALLLSLHPDWTRAEILARLSETVGPIMNSSASYVGRMGAGDLDVGAALVPDAGVPLSRLLESDPDGLRRR